MRITKCRSVRGGAAMGVAVWVVGLAMWGAALPAQAQKSNTIFPEGWDNSVRQRLFMRFGYTYAHVKTDSGDVKDVTGNVVSKDELLAAFAAGQAISATCPACEADLDDGQFIYNAGVAPLEDALRLNHYDGIGTPEGIKIRGQKNNGTPTISVGYWLDDDAKWLLETFVFGLPLSIKVYGDGVRDNGVPNQINGRHVATVKLLPPIVMGTYHFLPRTSLIRPYVGVGAMYAIFFGAKSTPLLDAYQGGKSSISVKNTLGVGPFVGVTSALNDKWHLNLSVGQIKLKTTSTMITRNTQIYSGDLVLKDYPGNIGVSAADLAQAIKSGDAGWLGTEQTASGQPNGLTTALMTLVKRARHANDLGTFERKVDSTFDNTLVTMSVGYQF